MFFVFITKVPERRENTEHSVLPIPWRNIDFHAMLRLKVTDVDLNVFPTTVSDAHPVLEDVGVNFL
jgi:hypothetical protein